MKIKEFNEKNGCYFWSRISAKGLINFLVNETELVEVRDDIEDDGSITYFFKLECPSMMLAVELMIAWVDNE